MHLTVFSRLIMIEQSLFCLPWVLSSSLLALYTKALEKGEFTFPPWSLWVWIIFAFTAARTAGMSFNRLIDKDIDRANPRTANRSLPSGEVTSQQVLFLAIISILFFILACAFINIRCLFMSPVVVLLLWMYSYSKRYTAGCHFILGFIHFFSPIFAWTAITGTWAWPPIILGIAIWMSIAGSDIIYALQDYAFDRQHQLYSIPALLGERRSVLLARCLHAAPALLFILLGIYLDLGFVFFIGNFCIVGIYLYFHRLINPAKPEEIYRLFFYCNSAVALVLLSFIIGTLSWHALL